MTTTDIQRLRALAEKATPGPWRLVHNSWDISTVYDAMSNPVAQCPIDPDVDEETQEPKEAQKQDTAEYLATLDPATVIALCDLAEKAHPEPAQAQVSDVREAIMRVMRVERDHAVEVFCAADGQSSPKTRAEFRAAWDALKLIVPALSAPLPDGRLPYGGGVGNG